MTTSPEISELILATGASTGMGAATAKDLGRERHGEDCYLRSGIDAHLSEHDTDISRAR